MSSSCTVLASNGILNGLGDGGLRAHGIAITMLYICLLNVGCAP
jgi:hypothetical protein